MQVVLARVPVDVADLCRQVDRQRHQVQRGPLGQLSSRGVGVVRNVGIGLVATRILCVVIQDGTIMIHLGKHEFRPLDNSVGVHVTQCFLGSEYERLFVAVFGFLSGYAAWLA